MHARVVLSLSVVAVLAATSPVTAQSGRLDPEAKTPYFWRVVLKIQPHPLLSPTFRDGLKRDLEAALQPSLGTLGAVEVIDLASAPRDHWDPLWQQFDDKGFAALESPRDLTGIKTHFLKLEYRDGLYLIETRQHDGFTGLSSGYAGFGSPVVRKQATRAPELVGRIAGLMVDHDFGLEGTLALEPNLDPKATVKEVRVIVRGGQLGALDRLVKVGDVFATSDVFETERKQTEVRTATGKLVSPPPGAVPPPVFTSRLRSYSLLKVTEVGTDGTLKCESLGRNFTMSQRNHVGFRCLKLGTIDGPLVVRLVGTSSNPAMLGSVRMTASEKGFNPDDDGNRLDLRNGLFFSNRPLSNVACVTASIGGASLKRFPVPILGEEVVNLPYEIKEGAEGLAEFKQIAQTIISRITDARKAQTVCFEATAELIKRGRNPEALTRAKKGKQSAETAAVSVKEDLDLIQQMAEKLQRASETAEFVTAIKRNLTALEKANEQLAAHIKTLQLVVDRENDPTLAIKEREVQNKQELIKDLLTRGEVDEALNVYDQLLTILKDDAAVKGARDKLAADWKPKNDEHAKARDYLLKSWPKVSTIPEFRDSLSEVTRCIDVCKKNGDKYALRKLLMMFNTAASKLVDLNAALDPNSDADKKLVEAVQTAAKTLAAKEIEIQEFLK